MMKLLPIYLLCCHGYRRCHIWSFVWCFGYLGFFRTTEWFNIAAPPGHVNAVQLFLTLRVDIQNKSRYIFGIFMV